MAAEIPGTLERVTSDRNARSACGDSPASSIRVARWSTVAGVLSALGVCAACCLLPFLLISLGITSAWVGTLEQLASFKWYFVAATAVLLGFGFYVVYFRPRPSCEAGPTCRKCAPSRATRVSLWLGVALAIGGLLFEQIEPLLS
jgi:mercuric ion transport protein